MQTLRISKRINQTLTQRQKIIAIIESIGLINSDDHFSELELKVLDTVASIFHISDETVALLREFVTSESLHAFNTSCIPVAGHQIRERSDALFLELMLSGQLTFLYEKSTDLYFVKYEGEEDLSLNSMPIVAKKNLSFFIW